jgi:hypothetical protein
MTRAFVLALLLSLLPPCADAVPQPARPVTDACIAKGRVQSGRRTNARPTRVASECAAAAIAEIEFLKFTKNEVTSYRIFLMEQSNAHWSFMVQGVKNGLPDVGYHWMVTVDKATGNAELIPGK